MTFEKLLQVAEVRQESHGKDTICLTVYTLPSGLYACGIQCRLGRMIRAFYPNQNSPGEKTKIESLEKALKQIALWAEGNRNILRRLDTFQLVQVKQLEFDFG